MWIYALPRMKAIMTKPPKKERRQATAAHIDQAEQIEKEPHRFISRDGSVNIRKEGLERRQSADWYHFLINLNFPNLLLLLALYFICANALFALLYMADPSFAATDQPHDFFSLFFFSVQIFTTLGFDQIRPVSMFSNALMSFESFTGWCSFGLMAGVLLNRISRPVTHIMFSEKAVITPFDGRPTLVFRAANRRGTQLLQAEINVSLTRNEKTREGEYIRRVYELPLLRGRTSFFNLTWTLRHVIDESSPLHGATVTSLRRSESEIIVLLSGIDEKFGQAVYSHFAYNHEEIIFDAHFKSMFARDEYNKPLIDFSNFDVVDKDKG